METNNQKLKMLDLNQPSVNGVGVFFAVCRTAIASCSWARKDFQAVQLVEGQLAYLEKFCRQEFGDAPVPEVAPAKTEEAKPEPTKPVEKSEAPKKVEDEIIDPTDKGEKRKVPMPDSILEKVIEGVEASKNFAANPPKDPVQEIPLPSSKDEYDQVF
jgi:hypothetical protein